MLLSTYTMHGYNLGLNESNLRYNNIVMLTFISNYCQVLDATYLNMFIQKELYSFIYVKDKNL